MESQAVETPFEEQRKDALNHYNDLAAKCNHWSSFVPKAIKAYNPTPDPDPFLLWVDEQILRLESFKRTDYGQYRLEQFTEVKEKYLSLKTTIE